jgi:hypothetical protein
MSAKRLHFEIAFLPGDGARNLAQRNLPLEIISGADVKAHSGEREAGSVRMHEQFGPFLAIGKRKITSS